MATAQARTPASSASNNNDDARWARTVWQVVQDIPEGHVLTYGEVARLAGQPKAARRVAGAIRRAPDAMDLPWHRVINAQGRISFPKDSWLHGQQKRLLQNEGVVFEKGRVDLADYGYDSTVDHLVWGRMAGSEGERR